MLLAVPAMAKWRTGGNNIQRGKPTTSGGSRNSSAPDVGMLKSHQLPLGTALRGGDRHPRWNPMPQDRSSHRISIPGFLHTWHTEEEKSVQSSGVGQGVVVWRRGSIDWDWENVAVALRTVGLGKEKLLAPPRPSCFVLRNTTKHYARSQATYGMTHSSGP